MALLRGMKQLRRARWRQEVIEKSRTLRPFSRTIPADEPFLPQIMSHPLDFKKPVISFKNQMDGGYVEF